MKKACPICGSRSNYDEEQNHCFSCGITKVEMRVGGMYFDPWKNQVVGNLRCCGNCKQALASKKVVWCKERNRKTHPYQVCNMWRFDGLTYDGRKV